MLKLVEQRNLPTGPGYLAGGNALGEEGDNGARYFLAAFELSACPRDWKKTLPIVGIAEEPALSIRFEPELARELQLFVEQQADFFASFARARDRDYYRYGLTLGSDGRARILRVSNAMRRAARQQCVLCLYEQSTDDAAGALDACGGILDLSMSFKDEPFVIIGLIRIAVESLAVEMVEQALSRTTPSIGHLKHLRSKVLANAEGIDVRAMTKSEIAYWVYMAQNVPLYIANSVQYQEEFLASEQFAERRHMMEHLLPKKPLPSKSKMRLWLNANRVWSTLCPGSCKHLFARSVEMLLESYDDAELPSWEQAAKASDRLLQEKSRIPESESWARLVLRMIEHQTRMRVAATALSLECYRIEHGKWPETLAALEGNAQLDPLNGKELKYRLTDSGCMIYSIGRNQRNDAGERTRDGGKDDIAFHLFDGKKRNVQQ